MNKPYEQERSISSLTSPEALKTWLLLDTADSVLEGDALIPFAYDELLCRKVGEGHMPIVHLWRHRNAFVVGLRDRRLPNAQQAMTSLRERQCSAIVRNSGGAAVPLDEGVVNVSVILPKPPGTIDFHRDFERMANWIRGAVIHAAGTNGTQAEVVAGEIEGSYCPGDFDISIGGRKFCGIAQRRQTKAFIIQAFIVVEGNGASRGERALRFYEIAVQGPAPAGTPEVKPEQMGSLSELAGIGSAAEWAKAFIEYFSEKEQVVFHRLNGYLPEWTAEMECQAAEMRKRYDA